MLPPARFTAPASRFRFPSIRSRITRSPFTSGVWRHRDWHGQGVGAGLFKDAVLSTAKLAAEIGIRALLCHAIDENAKKFYLHHGFIESPIEPLTVMLSIARLAKGL